MFARLFSLLLFILSCSLTTAQMTLHPSSVEPLTPDNIIQNVFLGNGIELLESSHSGLPGSIGLFDNALEEIGLEKGIVLSTGFAANVIKPNSEENPISNNTTNKSVKDADLEAIAGVEVVDVVKYEITFIPSSDLLSFRYVFASEEYPDFTCGDANDVFGFFISGKKPGGGEYVSENIARVPDPNEPGEFLDLPVSINSVNAGEAGVWTSGTCSGPNESLDYAQFYNIVSEGETPALNAYLDVFIAQAAVIPCETYTIKIALGDGNDQNEDSVVFLEERSFSTGTISIDINNPGIDGGLAEGCDSGYLRLHLPEPVTEDFPIDIKVLSGPNQIAAAIPDVDFVGFPDDIFIPAGKSYVDLNINPIDDNLDEETEYIFLEIRRSICIVDTLILPLVNNNLESVTLADTIYACNNQPFRLEADLGDEVNPSSILTFENRDPVEIDKDNNYTESKILVSGLKDITLNPDIISEICIDNLVHPRLNDLDIFLKAPSGQIIELTTDNGFRTNNDDQPDAYIGTCFTQTATTSINLGDASEGKIDLANPTYTGAYLPEGSFDDWLLPISSTLNGDYTLFIVDDQKQFDGDLFSWHISINPKYELDYTWAPNTELECAQCEVATGLATESRFYYISLTDSYGCATVDSVWLEVSEEPQLFNLECAANRSGAISYIWSESQNAQFYEFRLNGANEWITMEVGEVLSSSFYDLNYTDLTSLEVTGLLPGETFTLEVRGSNFGRCMTDPISSTCTAIDCQGAGPIIDDIRVDQPTCASQTTARVEVLANSDNLPLTYRVKVNAFTAENTDGIFFALPQGEWLIRVTDSAGCAVENNLSISMPRPILINEEVTAITCRDADDAIIDLAIDGAFPPYSYSWNDGNEDALRTNLQPNFYTVTVTDSQDCTAQKDIRITNPEELEVDFVQSEELNCVASNEVFATLNVEGGVRPYVTTWNGTINQDTLFGIDPERLSYTLTDSSGCVLSGDVLPRQAAALEIEFLEVSDNSCFNSTDGSALAAINHGTEPFTYEWSNGEMGERAVALGSEITTLVVTDINGCSAAAEIETGSPARIDIESDFESPSCFGESDASIELSVGGGSGNFSYLWEDGIESKDRMNISSGRYCVTITDQAFCTSEFCVDIPPTLELDASAELTRVGCDNRGNGAITITPSGGSGQYDFSWSGPNGYSSSDQNISNLQIGAYTLILTDLANPACQSAPLEFTLSVESEIGALIQTIDEISCFGEATGVLRALPTGGNPPFSYNWSDNSIGEFAENLTAGIYEVTITDASNCSSISTKLLDQPEELVASTSKEDILCFGDESGTIVIESSGGLAPYSYSWSNQETNSSSTNLAAGTYEVTITDASACALEISETITEPENDIEFSIEVKDVTCSDGSNGIISLESTNGSASLRYSLDNEPFSNNGEFRNLRANTYSITAQDINGCMLVQEVTISEADPIEVRFINELEVLFGDNLQIDLEIQNIQGDETFLWDAPEIENFSCTDCLTPMISNVTKSFSGSIMIIDAQLCESTIFFNVNVLEDGIIEVPTGFSPNNDNVNDVLFVMGDPQLYVNSFKIFSRWGEEVFSAEQFHPGDSSTGWNGKVNGKDVQQDSYVWIMECVMRSGNVEILKGQTTLFK